MPTAKLTFRARLFTVISISACSALIVLWVSTVLSQKVREQFALIGEQYVPQIELGPQLEQTFAQLSRGFQDAAGASDPRALAATQEVKASFLEQLARARGALEPEVSAKLRGLVESYYTAGYEVTAEMIAGATGEETLGRIEDMQRRKALVESYLRRSLMFDKAKLVKAFDVAFEAQRFARSIVLWVSLSGILLVCALSYWISQGSVRAMDALNAGFTRFGRGDFETPIHTASGDELEQVATLANAMVTNLRTMEEDRKRSDWLKEGLAGLNEEVRGELTPEQVAQRTLHFVATRVGALVGAIYLGDEEGHLRLAGELSLHHANDGSPSPQRNLRVGDGLLGNAALNDDVAVVANVPDGYLQIHSGLGRSDPTSLVLVPFRRLGRIMGVLELASFSPISAQQLEFLAATREGVAVALEAALSRRELERLLASSRELAERLAAQEEELRNNNQELLAQQEELRATNDDLALHRNTLAQQNEELEEARNELQEKAQELGRANQYKSQFLANMSHELRTPLNSMLLLSHLLGKNDAGNLTAKQVEHCQIVHAAGKDLLALINQILDLAKIEAGKQDVYLDSVALEDIASHMLGVFAPLAAEKNLALDISVAPGLPETIITDQSRLERILTNLLGNAIKFTERGRVTLSIGRPELDIVMDGGSIPAKGAIAFSVSDTGVGIPNEALERIFAPFEQLEARTQRRYGGTGLGLAISHESARLLGGVLRVQSVLDEGSTFTCYLPERGGAARDRDSARARASLPVSPGPTAPLDDRRRSDARSAHLLLIEDDRVLVEQLLEIIHARGLTALAAGTGAEGLLLARSHRPQGIILDVRLPDMDGFSVMEQLRRDPSTCDIPVHFISAVDAPERGFSLGAVGYLVKPVSPTDLSNAVRLLAPGNAEQPSRVLVVEDDPVAAEALIRLLAEQKLEATHATNAKAAMNELAASRFGCMILDLGLPDMDGLGLLDHLSQQRSIQCPPVIVYTARSLTKEETRRLYRYTETVVLKDGQSEQRLIEELRLLAGHVKAAQAPDSSAVVTPSASNVSLAGKKLLVADDDMRTAYSLAALLRTRGAEVMLAENGVEALALLAKHSEVDAVLMDIMMPTMDGYEAMRRLREDRRNEQLPVIALTAKAMQGERERCLGAGASDYLAKPVDGDQLLLMLQKHIAMRAADGSR